jgi:hypothetical protein
MISGPGLVIANQHRSCDQKVGLQFQVEYTKFTIVKHSTYQYATNIEQALLSTVFVFGCQTDYFCQVCSRLSGASTDSSNTFKNPVHGVECRA